MNGLQKEFTGRSGSEKFTVAKCRSDHPYKAFRFVYYRAQYVCSSVVSFEYLPIYFLGTVNMVKAKNKFTFIVTDKYWKLIRGKQEIKKALNETIHTCLNDWYTQY